MRKEGWGNVLNGNFLENYCIYLKFGFYGLFCFGSFSLLAFYSKFWCKSKSQVQIQRFFEKFYGVATADLR